MRTERQRMLIQLILTLATFIDTPGWRSPIFFSLSNCFFLFWFHWKRQICYLLYVCINLSVPPGRRKSNFPHGVSNKLKSYIESTTKWKQQLVIYIYINFINSCNLKLTHFEINCSFSFSGRVQGIFSCNIVCVFPISLEEPICGNNKPKIRSKHHIYNTWNEGCKLVGPPKY